MRPRARHLDVLLGLSTACVAGITGSPAAAQAPSAWSELSVPSGVQTGALSQRGKVLAYQDGTTVHAYSALTRSWDTTAITPQGGIRVANDLVLVEDGNRFTAFASYTGRFAGITLNGGALVVNPAANRNDSIVLVRDGSDLWAFSCFVGSWTRRTVSGQAQIAVERGVAVVADGLQLAGMSAFRGQWVQSSLLAPAASVHAHSSLGIAQNRGEIHGFSGQRGTWASTTPLPNATGFAIDHDLAVWWDGLGCIGYSGLRGSFAGVLTGMAVKVEVGAQVALAHKDNQFWAYSAALGTWTHASTATTPVSSVSSSHAVLIDRDRVLGFSGPRGRFASVAMQAQQVVASATVAAALDTSGGALFSALTGNWTRLPPQASGQPRLANTGALLRIGNGFTAYCARTDSFHDLAASATAVPHVDADSAILAVEDGSRLAVFEPRRQVWISTPVLGTSPLAVALWRTSLVAFDGVTAFGFGSFHGRIEGHRLSGPSRGVSASSESARALTDRVIAVFSAVPLLSSPWQYPEFRRTFAAGSDLDVHLSAASANGQAFLALGAQPPFVLPGLGEVFLDGALLLPLTLALDARNGTARTTIPVPDLPGLQGLELFMQALVIPTAGSPYVTDLASVLLY